ncbi:MAG: NFACT family protein [Firmicutes bacterium]|nr:NFACT family protein [Bacillota bacterium]
MAIDGILLNGLVGELQATLINARVDKIQQPEKDEIHIIMRNQGENYKLLLSASASHPRIHLTKINKINPQTPPMFCMVLRKHLTGGKLVSIHQPSFERIIEISFEVLNEMGDLTEKKLIIEIMGRHSNIIFIDSAGKILDSIKHVGINISRVREVLPGITYTYPPSQGKSDPRCANEDTLTNYLNSLENTQRPDRAVTDAFTGISKTSAEEIINIASNGDYGSIRLDEQGIP